MEYLVKFLTKKTVAENTVTFYFDKPESFNFQPGQYIDLFLKNESGESALHIFSLSSAPEEKDLAITTRLTGSKYKNILNSLEPNAAVRINGPLGNLILPNETTQKIVFLAGGIGITPFRSMLKSEEIKISERDLTLFYANPDQAKTAFFEEFNRLKLKNFHFVPIMTQDSNWTGETARISEPLLNKYLGDLSNYLFYIVGSMGFSNAVRDTLQSACVLEKNIRVEEFPGY